MSDPPPFARDLAGTYVRAPACRWGWGIDTSLEQDVQALSLLPGGRFFEIHSYDRHYAARAAGTWALHADTVRLSGVREVLTSDALPFDRRESFAVDLAVRHEWDRLALIHRSTLSDGTAIETPFHFVGAQVCVVPFSKGFPAEWFPTVWGELAGWADALLEREVARNRASGD